MSCCTNERGNIGIYYVIVDATVMPATGVGNAPGEGVRGVRHRDDRVVGHRPG